MKGALKRALCAPALIAAALTAAACGNTAGGSGDADGGYPQGRISIMAPADPGGGWDETARALQQTIREAKLADGAEVYNVPGAGGTLGLSQLATKERGEPEQLMVMGLVMLGAIETNASAVGLDEVTPIAALTEEAEAIVVPATSRYRTLDDLMADLEEDPGSIAWAGGSAGGTDQLLVGQLADAVGVDPAKTRYVAHSGGGEALTAILSGSVDAGVSGASEFADQVEAGKLRVLAVSGEEPLEVGGTVAETLKQQGYDVVMTNWRGIVAPPGLSDEQREQVIAFVEQLRRTPEWQANLKRFRWDELDTSGAAFEAFLDREQQRVQRLVSDLQLAS